MQKYANFCSFICSFIGIMNTKVLVLVFGIIIGLIVWYLIAKIYFLIKTKHQRKDAVDRSRSAVLGNVNEKIAPLLPDFRYNYKDLVFLGKGIDYLVFDGLSGWNLKKIVFLEVKSWKSQLNANERMIKECISDQKISYEVYRLPY